MMRASVAQSFARRWFFQTLAWIEEHRSANHEMHYRPTFIVGPPRGGITLIRQLIAWSIPTSYFSNLTTTSRLILGFPLPGTTALLAKWLRGSRNLQTFENDYGYTRGAGAPTEGEFIWSYFFKTRYGPVDPGQVTSDQRNAIYQAVAATERAFDLPFVNKSAVLSLRIRALVKIFPDALFIHVTRDSLDVAQSIFRARRSRYASWIGPRPRQCAEETNKSLREQVCDQVHYVEENIAYERLIVGESRFLSVAYKDVCDGPLRQLERIAHFMRSHGVPAKILRAVPKSFTHSHGCKVDQADYMAMRAYFEKLVASEHEFTSSHAVAPGDSQF